MNILLCGANGFIGRHLAAALAARGHRVLRGVHSADGLDDAVAIDYTRDHSPEIWRPRLEGVDVVINAVGILREVGGATFGALHARAPIALFEAASQAGVRRIVQISALGADDKAQSRYHRSKKQADDYLATLPVDWVVVQPSLVYGPDGASARLFETLASLPFVPLPAGGRQAIQPVHIDDLVEALVRLVEHEGPLRGVLPAVGAEAITFRDWLMSLRAQLGLPRTLGLPIPHWMMRSAAALGERLPGLLDRETLAMLERGNTASCETMTALLGRLPRDASRFIAADTARERALTARSNWMLPLLRFSVALVWILTGLVSLGLYPVEASYALLAQVGITGAAAPVALYGAALLDLAFGVGVYALEPPRRRWLWRAQMLLILAYSVIIALALPEYRLHPFGPLLKNVPLFAVILLLHEFEDVPRRWTT
ncbi:MAG: SDR family oxidoreductase [Burkholderiales bacterium]|nr:SDR family oxidoreductase [Burkholderiales bacterium]